ncbi:hypothetical protein L0B53_03925 [Vibrio sp. SS-MA-C1-2]|uniref:hypothetical protein n=1 Tax=Vibrio sp. SS-MA-C1-2 TaxID=2908646 RepID=UPI001F39306F|nr:hypothetical protein [Vibrio sp. SS-MA-C1-2]UJF17081.1 hypothetical protein L0B53_03925 [Vibrio sp. SS-MA-C1-2]
MSFFSIPVPDNFGNYMIKDMLSLIVLPDSISLWYQRLRLQLALVFIIAIVIIVFICRNVIKLGVIMPTEEPRIRKLKKLPNQQALIALPSILKQVALL